MSSLAATETATAFVEKRPLERYATPAQPSLVGMPRAMLAQALAETGVPEGQRRMRVQQIWHWLYVRGAQDFDAMTTLSKDLRAALAQRFTLARPPIAAEQISVDGTRKWLIQLPGERAETPHEVECVYIPETDRGTLCISSQVGCTLNCSFCHTGTQRLVRNLTAAEIGAQVVVARDRLGDWVPGDTPARTTAPSDLPLAGGSERRRLVSNVVMMGMGEPLYNFEAVRDGINVIADGEGLSVSKRRITLSTSGVVPNITRAGAEIGSMLAVSLHAVTDEVRDQLVPLNRKYPIAELLEACRNYPGLSNARRITFEYVMLKGVNDSLADAKALVRLLKGIPAKINLIPFNPWPGTKYECSDWDRIEEFSEVVFAAGYASPVRTPRGRDILAACGQLKSASEKLSARERLALRAMAMTD
ncbi:MAG TPA: 23S rRNA (adenine(2503)-C(2))-methyltransferase RlmN [Xanthobacteraceae bacterium]|nr:23S rRNA (adenine(2503)-C(2))-methyltransferase RlmN [Xanthobacteraceae bacterium]